ncbi:histidine phosphatase family protein [Microbacterium terricola]|uniref:phosphoglycerate mutase (2,3-diphosphoglycerate-dependent) n=1 Tax=Microbacterium terricola TaxID=344163 RepID=A0ABM8DVD9_9MICO|nr:histidine phosphatase family protein [Microbacterium terricola]UYK39648.1 histidine phosphatase family protein [Microbacterium terricola]BDV29611.1 phosphoglycerate mutase [Microbacterium terricola]
MAVNELWLVRHGESLGNEAATRAEHEGLERIPLDVRDADVELSPTGVEQAQALGTWLAGHRSAIDVFWVSPYLRARQTLAGALGEGAGSARVIVDERLRDRELGILDLLTAHGVARLHPEEAERRRQLGKFYHRPPGGESWADVALRLRSFLRDAADVSEGTAMVVAHDAIVMLFLYLMVPMEEAELLDFAAANTVLNASVTHVVRRGVGWELVDFSVVDHLVREGADVTVHPGHPDVQPE